MVDGRGCRVPGFEGGYFVGGTLLDRVQASMSCYQEEIFGPRAGRGARADLAAAMACWTPTLCQRRGALHPRRPHGA